MKNVFILFLMVSFVVSGCVSYDHYYKLDEQYLARRQLETRRYDTDDEETLLIASAQVLQDLGFTLDESETKLGLITANKDREAGSTAGKVGIILLAVLAGTQPVYDVSQKIYVTLVSTKNHDNKSHNIRVEFARVIWNNMNQARIEKIQDEEIYKDFFDKLSQSVFLTANNI
ncbi:MAG: hypothetical protein IJ019_04170 [Alphaproteobacteria bacterium]|nr:hypothetical protein [Alphaproteobacteria bacterium]